MNIIMINNSKVQLDYYWNIFKWKKVKNKPKKENQIELIKNEMQNQKKINL